MIAIESRTQRRSRNRFRSWLYILPLVLQSGCTLFFGNIKPVEEKSTTYRILDLSKDHSEWVLLNPQLNPNSLDPADSTDANRSDLAFQSKKTASIISINSACKTVKGLEKPRDLKVLTRELLLGISDMGVRQEKTIELQGIPALETTIQGKISNEEMMLQTVVLQDKNCVYDLMYVARPSLFDKDLPDFSKFVSSFRIR